MAENLLQFQNGSKSFGARILFDAVNFSINSGEHVGVIGPNGAGKTTLFSILRGAEEFDSGVVVKSRSLRMGYLSQHDHWDANQTGNEYLEQHSQIPLWDLKPKGRILQLTEDILARPIVSLSGGYRMRIKLLALLGNEPNLLLLDEPTNYLDLETTLLLEQFLQGYEGGFLLISHDREFLRRTTDHTLEVEGGEVTKYNGNIDDYFEQKQLLREQLAAQMQGQAEKRKTILDFVARFGASATKARQAQSRLKTLAKMETIEMKPLPVSSVIRIPPPIKAGRVVFTIQEGEFGYGEKHVLRKVNLNVERGDHIAVVGRNGAGKSTLLKALAGALAPLKGEAKSGLGVELGLFAQHVIESLDLEDTVYGALERAAHKEVLPQQILDMAGSLLFSGDEVRKKIKVLSGGEKSRVALGKILLKKCSCLILDEPTNHLDFQTVEALTNALNQYEGTVIVVSHDRGFIRRVGKKILEVNQGLVRLYPGSYEEYVWSLQKEVLEIPSNSVTVNKNYFSTDKTEDKENWKENKKNLERDLRIVDKKISQLEVQLASDQKGLEELNQKISDGMIPSKEDVENLAKLGRSIQDIEDEWLSSQSTRDELTAKIEAMKLGKIEK
jgi:ATP-binding cassette, subfamily F, member 3